MIKRNERSAKSHKTKMKEKKTCSHLEEWIGVIHVDSAIEFRMRYAKGMKYQWITNKLHAAAKCKPINKYIFCPNRTTILTRILKRGNEIKCSKKCQSIACLPALTSHHSRLTHFARGHQSSLCSSSASIYMFKTFGHKPKTIIACRLLTSTVHVHAHTCVHSNRSSPEPCIFCKQIIFCVRCLSVYFGVIFLWCVLLVVCITKQITFGDDNRRK